ncbi:hypothetical protein AB0K12_15740 [Nonomuraea sp. NPDC049419]|uniref:hypothetical protein n=1 Tax=Nonomuraea sp. NPDC049419 TaxID=3155772 RepID=UPI003413EA7A
MIPRSRTVSLLALGAICLAGCASEERPVQPQLKPLAMKEQVSNIVKSADGYAVNWAGVLTNANPWHFGEHVVATIVGHDAKGAEVLKLDQPLDAVPPGGSLAFTGQAPASVKPAKVTIQYRPARWRQAARIVSSFQPFPISRVQTLPQKDGSYLITGYVDNPYQMPVSSLVVTAMLRDKSGKLLGGGDTFVDDVKAGSAPRFVLSVLGLPKNAKVAKTEITARTWGSTGRPYEELALAGAVPMHTVKPTSEPFAVDRSTAVLSEHKQ